MTLYDLLFILLFLTTIGILVSCVVSALRGRGDRARRRLRRLGIGAAVYLSIVVAVSLLSPRHVLARGDDQCSDDWCIAVTDAVRSDPARTSVIVTFQISSRARRVSQRERFVVAYLRDQDGHRYYPEPAPDWAPFDTLLGPGESLGTTRIFRVPAEAVGLGVIVAREGDFPFPRCCIIGTGFFHKDPIVPLP